MKPGSLGPALACGLLCFGVSSLVPAQDPVPRSFSFAVIGDTPYYPHEEVYLKGLLDSFAREPIEFVVHAGDIKSGSSRCDNALYAARRNLFAASPRPFILVPGDNDWVDCQRPASGGYDPVERLGVLRKELFEGRSSLGTQVMQLERQIDDSAHSSYPEHARWTVGTVVFLTLNIAGGSNQCGKSEARARMRAVSAWLCAGFERARALRAPGTVIVFHGDPRFELAPGDRRRRGYDAFLDEVALEAQRFGKPVLLIHGDRHLYQLDRPWQQDPRFPPNVTRLSTFGSPFVNWVRVRVDPGSNDPFRIEPVYEAPDSSLAQ